MRLDMRRRFSRSDSRARARVLALAVVGSLTLASCGADTLPEPTDSAEEFAASIAQWQTPGTLAEGSDDPDLVWEALTALEETSVEWQLESAHIHEEEDDDADNPLPAPPGTEPPTLATATYTVTWDLAGLGRSGETWEYPTEVDFVWNEDTETWDPVLTADALMPGLDAEGRVVVATTAAPRGRILDGRGEPLMTNRPVHHIGIDKSMVEPEVAADSARKLADLLELDGDAFAQRVEASGERAWVELITLRADGSVEVPHDEIEAIPGARALADTAVLAPTRNFARSILGVFGEPTAEQIENSEGRLTSGVAAGLSGLQATWDEELSGQAGLDISVEAPGGGSMVGTESVSYSQEPVDGASITTTLDIRVQELAEAAIADAEVPAGLVVLRPSDGHVLAAADGPEGMSTPIAVSGAYAPGSTFKIVTALAMLRNGMTPDSQVSCPQTINAAGTQIANYEGYPSAWLGSITLQEAIAQSCNTVFVDQWDQITAEEEQDAARALGLLPSPVTGLDGTFLGRVPDDSTGTEHAANLFGQGVIQTSPLGMATVAASVGAGSTVQPVLVIDPEVDPTDNENLPLNQPLTEEEATQLRQMMGAVVTEGTVPILQDVPGEPVYAKTGTAQFVSEGETLAHTWIIAIQGDLAVALFFNEGFAGAQTNGPVLQQFLTELADIDTSAPTTSNVEG